MIATAEPRGAYHLAPLAAELASDDTRWRHLLPYPEPTQGDPVVPVTTDLDELAAADRVIITGGTLNPWTTLVAREASARGVPVLYSQLAAVPPVLDVPASYACVRFASTLCPADRGTVAALCSLDPAHVTVTGIPALDGMPAWRPVPSQVLLLSTSDMAERDPNLELLRLARMLQADGFSVRVRCHPREDRAPWAGFDVVTNETQAESAATASVVVGYPGSAHVLAAAVGAPVVSLEPTPELSQVLSPAERRVVTTVRDAAAALAAVLAPAPSDSALLEAAVGPLGDAAASVVAFWRSSLIAS